MTYEAEEESVEAGQPVELFKFTLGATIYRYTSAEDEINFAAQTWLPRPITRSAPSQSLDDRTHQLEITLPTEDEVASKFIGIVPGQLMECEITRFHRGDGASEAFILWQGRITGATYKKQGAQCSLRGLTTEAAFDRSIPRYKYQGLCNHILYDTRCAVVKSSFQYTGTVGAVTNNVVEVVGLFASKGAGWALGGYVSNNDVDYRLVTAQSGDNLTLILPFEANVAGTSVNVFAGCDHTLEGTHGCEPKFSNEINYGGFHWVPILNVFETGLD